MTTNTTARTPGPWKVGPVDDTVITGPDGSVVAEIDGDYNQPDLWPIMEANAAFIVRAANSHDDAIAAMQDALWHLGTDEDRAILVDQGHGWRTGTEEASAKLRAALAKARQP